MNVALRALEYYDHDDFKENYVFALHNTYNENEGDIINRIIELFNVRNYETEKYLSNHIIIDREQAQKIYDFINENIEEFTTEYCGCYVGYTSLESCSYGEQEEQLTGWLNHKTDKPYTIGYMRRVFSENDFYVDGDYAYYVLDGGQHIDLLNNVELLNEFLTTI